MDYVHPGSVGSSKADKQWPRRAPEIGKKLQEVRAPRDSKPDDCPPRIDPVRSRGRWERRVLELWLRTAGIALALATIGCGSMSVDRANSASRNGDTPARARARQVVGCRDGSGGAVNHGSRSRPVIALTFDDGPSLTYTPRILSILNRLHASATFFEEGRHVPHREALMRQILASGDEIGNHSFTHPRDPGYGQLRGTDRRIKAATGFTPCLFRPPYGLIDPKVVSAARRNHLEMILWDVDSRDDKHPGVAAIRSNAVDLAQPGSIILMHDGGHHPQTVAALPAVIRGLRSRGFRFATITALLGGKFVYRDH
jgi:peptidoglycan-N-acetylglucosamine deacetylase